MSDRSFPAGHRNDPDAPKADDGWQLGGRKDDGADFSQAEADRRARQHAERPHGYKGSHRA